MSPILAATVLLAVSSLIPTATAAVQSSSCKIDPTGSTRSEPSLTAALNDVLGPILNLTYDDTALVAATQALGLSVLRHPGGTVANYWSIDNGTYVWNCTGCSCCSFKEQIDSGFPPKTFTPQNFVKDLVSNFRHPAAPIYDINVYTLTMDEAVAQLDALAGTEMNVTQIELGNEFYLKSYTWTPEQYARVVKDIVPVIRNKFPGARIAAVAHRDYGSQSSSWNKGIKPLAAVVDAFTVHDYSLSASFVNNFEPALHISAILGYSAALLPQISANLDKTFRRTKTPIWMTEFNQAIHDQPNMTESTHALFAASRIVTAVNSSDVYRVLQLHAFGSEEGVGWDNQAGIVRFSAEKNNVSAVRVGAIAQMMAHMSFFTQDVFQQVGSTTSSGSCPDIAKPILDQQVACIHAFVAEPDAVRNHSAAMSPSASRGYVVINACPQAVLVDFDAGQPCDSSRSADVITYKADTKASWTPLPPKGTLPPWPAPYQPMPWSQRKVPIDKDSDRLSMDVDATSLSFITISTCS